MPFNPTFPTWQALNAANYSSPSGFTDLRTGQPVYAGGLVLGAYFDLTEYEANNLSDTLIGTLHAGRYRLVQVDSGATAANVKTGTVGLLKTTAAGVNVVTSYDHGLAPGVRPVVFLNAVTPGNYGFIQELGDATLLCGATISNTTPAIGNYVNSVATGVIDDPVTQNAAPTTVGVAMQVPAANALIRVLLELPVVQG